MEYILGSIITLISVITINKLVRSALPKNNFSFQVSQSYLFKILSEYNTFDTEDKVFSETQAYKHVKKHYVKIMIVDQEAYWIKDNQLYVAEFKDGEINSETTREVDTMAMDKLELERTMFVVEKLSEGETDELGNSGKS